MAWFSLKFGKARVSTRGVSAGAGRARVGASWSQVLPDAQPPKGTAKADTSQKVPRGDPRADLPNADRSAIAALGDRMQERARRAEQRVGDRRLTQEELDPLMVAELRAFRRVHPSAFRALERLPGASPEERAEFQRLLQKLDDPTPAASRNASKPGQTQRTQDDYWELQPGRIAEVMGVDVATVRGWVQEKLLTEDASGRIIVDGRGRTSRISKSAIERSMANRRATMDERRKRAPRSVQAPEEPKPTGDIVTRLERLAALRADGAISSAEYTKAKQAVLEGR
jgi:hypothetical protein